MRPSRCRRTKHFEQLILGKEWATQELLKLHAARGGRRISDGRVPIFEAGDHEGCPQNGCFDLLGIVSILGREVAEQDEVAGDGAGDRHLDEDFTALLALAMGSGAVR